MRPTEATLMRRFVSRLHGPVILTDRESDRLLDTLKASFRHHLDVEHPPPSASPPRRSIPSRPSLSHTERHVASVLTNPLLTAQRDVTSQSNKGALANVIHPAKVLEASIIDGSASIDSVHECLLAFRQSLKSASPKVRRDALAKHQVGSKVLSWLWATGQAYSTAWSSHQQTCKAIAFFVLRENREDAIRNWIVATSERLATQHRSQSADLVALQSTLLHHLVAWEIRKKSDGLRTALETFTQYLKSQSSEYASQISAAAGAHLIHYVTLHKAEEVISKDDESLRAFLGGTTAWIASSTEPLAIDAMRLKLSHFGKAYIDEAIAVAYSLDSERTADSEVQYGSKLSQYLIELADVIHVHGTREHAASLAKLMMKVQQDENGSQESMLHHFTGGVPALLLHDIRSWHSDVVEEPTPG